MTIRTRRKRVYSGGLTIGKLSELMTGERHGYVRPYYNGYGGEESEGLMPSDEMKGDWQRFRAEILEFWISGRAANGREFRLTPSSDPIDMSLGWLAGRAYTRPWAWWYFDAPEVRGDELQAEYLIRLDLLLPGESEMRVKQIPKEIESVRENRKLLDEGAWVMSDEDRRQRIDEANREIGRLELELTELLEAVGG